jgi:hypothetical protein
MDRVPGGGGIPWRAAQSATMFEGGSLAVKTTNVRDGYLRDNGVPTARTHRCRCTSIARPHRRLAHRVVDSRGSGDLTQLLYLSRHFKKEPNGSK